jgi:hypothetical protein
MVFPSINTWQVQVTWGYNKGTSARSFKLNLLLHLAQIVLQHVIFLTTLHTKTIRKANSKWACGMRTMVQERELIVQESLNED